MRINWKHAAGVISLALLATGGFVVPPLLAGRVEKPPSAAREGDRELAHLLVKLVLKTRAVMAGHYTRKQSRIPGVDFLYQRTLAGNRILPAAVADEVFSEVVPHATGGRAWVKMVVPEPRNPNNKGDSTALEMLEQIQGGAPSAERNNGTAYYYGEPILAKKSCLPCHGEPKGEPDPTFPKYKKNGWRDGDVVGAVISRVARKK